MQTNAYQLLSPCYKCTITDDDHDNNDNDDDHDNDEMMMHDHDSEDDHHHVDKNFIPTNACQLAPHVLKRCTKVHKLRTVYLEAYSLDCFTRMNLRALFCVYSVWVGGWVCGGGTMIQKQSHCEL